MPGHELRVVQSDTDHEPLFGQAHEDGQQVRGPAHANVPQVEVHAKDHGHTGKGHATGMPATEPGQNSVLCREMIKHHS
jgi:hypothetical protein